MTETFGKYHNNVRVPTKIHISIYIFYRVYDNHSHSKHSHNGTWTYTFNFLKNNGSYKSSVYNSISTTLMSWPNSWYEYETSWVRKLAPWRQGILEALRVWSNGQYEYVDIDLFVDWLLLCIFPRSATIWFYEPHQRSSSFPWARNFFLVA